MTMQEVPLPTYETLLTEAIRSLAVDSGVVSSPVSAGGNSLNDATKAWAINIHKNRLVKIIRGAGAGQLAVIDGNSHDSLIIKGQWSQSIGAGTVYVILDKDIAQILTDVFGSGSTIQEANLENLRINDDALQSIQLEHRLGRSLNGFFNARHLDTPPTRADIDTHWTSAGINSGANGIAIYSRRTFHYPLLAAYGIWPTLAAGAGLFWVGFEGGAEGPAGLVGLCLSNNVLQAVCSDIVSNNRLDIQDYLAAGYDSTRWAYRVKLNKSNAEFTIPRVGASPWEPCAIILHSLTEDIPSWTNTAGPYLLMGNSYSIWLGMEMTAFIEISANRTFNLDPTTNCFVAADGDPLPPRQYVLYNENTTTKWNGQAVAAGTITSHPVPVWGYPRKTLFFQANGAGTLLVQVYAGGAWRTLQTVVIAANALDIEVIDSETPIMRCTFTPTAYPTTVNVAEFYLS